MRPQIKPDFYYDPITGIYHKINYAVIKSHAIAGKLKHLIEGSRERKQPQITTPEMLKKIRSIKNSIKFIQFHNDDEYMEIEFYNGMYKTFFYLYKNPINGGF